MCWETLKNTLRQTYIPQMTREEVELAVKKLQDGQAGEDEILADAKNGGKVMID